MSAFAFAIPRARYREDDGKKVRPASRGKHLGARNRRVIHEVTRIEAVVLDGKPTTREYEYRYHATKGWRRERLPA